MKPKSYWLFILVIVILALFISGCERSNTEPSNPEEETQTEDVLHFDADMTPEPTLTMAEQYPEVWQFLNSTYDDMVFLGEDGSFQWIVREESADFSGIYAEYLPDESEYTPYNGDDLVIVADEFINDAVIGDTVIGYALRCSITNNMGEEMDIYNEIPKLQIYLDEKWWTIASAHESNTAQMYWKLQPGTTYFMKSMIANISERPFPSGHYRIVFTLSPVHDAYILMEYDHILK